MELSVRALMLRLTRPDDRLAAAKALAQRVGAQDLVVFALDPEVKVLLPAPGFAQTLPDIRAWRAFLAACVDVEAPHAGQISKQDALGIRGEDDTVMVLLGGQLSPDTHAQIAPLLPFVGSVFIAERLALSDKAHAMVARASARRAEELTESLSRTQAVLNAALRELHEKQEWLSTTLKSIGDAVIVTDAEGRVVFMNAVATQVSGWTQQEVKGEPLSAMFRIHSEETRATVESPVARALQTGQIAGLANHTYLVRKDGSEVFIDDSAAPIRNEAGRVTGAVLVFRDISERKAAEAEQAELRGKERMAHEFEQLLIGIVSHDLRNPLAAVLMSASLLEKSVTDPQSLKVVRRISSSGQRANRLVRDLLDFTQARLGGGLQVNPAPMDLHDVVKQVVDEARLANPERAIELEREGSGRGEWDSDRITQVINNLLANALRYSPPGTAVQLATHGQKDVVVLTIHNEGAPIPPQQLSMLFRPMHRGADRMQNHERSIGLGLYIVHHILAAHRGTVAVKSDAATGTTFTVTLLR